MLLMWLLQMAVPFPRPAPPPPPPQPVIEVITVSPALDGDNGAA